MPPPRSPVLLAVHAVGRPLIRVPRRSGEGNRAPRCGDRRRRILFGHHGLDPRVVYQARTRYISRAGVLLGVDAVRAAAHRATNRIVEPDSGALYKSRDEGESSPIRVSRTSAQHDQPVECRIAEGHAHQTGCIQRHGDGHLAGRFWTMASVRRSSENDGGTIENGACGIP